jgi:uncharacterized RDD family membrane protein YckC
VSTAQVDGDPIATVGQRSIARLIDWALLLAVWLLLGGATSQRLEDDTLRFPRWAILVWMALVVVYEAGFVAARGQTPGKMVVGIELVTLRDGRTPTIAASVARVMPVAFAMALLGSFFPIALVLVYFSAAFMANLRGILDLVAGTVVIQARRRQGIPGLGTG